MKHIYLFSGIGADYRAFQFLNLGDYETTYIDWIPNIKGEAIENYAQRLLSQIKTDNPILIGLSFGGIVAIEMAKLIKVEKVILIASVKTMWELPLLFRKTGWLNLQMLLPNRILVRSNFILNWLFGTQNKSDRKLLAEIVRDSDPVFLKWALGKVANWKNTTVPQNLIHIHGTADRLFAFKYAKGAVPVNEGGHFMTVNRAEELSDLIGQALKK